MIASQSVISGAFSLARQAIQLGYWPRLLIVQTSASTVGQVYVPAVNWALYAGTVGLVLVFRESGRLAGAYGMAVALAVRCLRQASRFWLGLGDLPDIRQ